MAILVFAESLTGTLKKPAFEAVTYARQTAEKTGDQVIALTIGKVEGAEELGVYGANKVYHVDAAADFDPQVYASIIVQAAQKTDAKTVIFAHSSTGKSLAGRVAAKLNAGSISGAISTPEVDGDALLVKKSVFSGKAFATYALKSAHKVISVMGNTFRPEKVADAATVETLDVDVPTSRLKVIETKTVEGVTPLPEAELVVSAGRGMKGPENWGIVEELATKLGATTACSRPVADIGWRPHHEHVGQTGVAIRPNLYIAVGISGAIQHLAGVNNSKVIVVINKDPEAPFFKAADYGVVGDLFDVMPRLIEAVDKFQKENA